MCFCLFVCFLFVVICFFCFLFFVWGFWGGILLPCLFVRLFVCLLDVGFLGGFLVVVFLYWFFLVSFCLLFILFTSRVCVTLARHHLYSVNCF